MKYHTLGSTKLRVSQVGLGCFGMSHAYGRADEKECINTLHHALDTGLNFFDTADMYGFGHNELLVAKAFKQQWQKLVIATKFGIVIDPHHPKKRLVNAKPAYVKAACDASLQRLGVDVIDLYYLHRLDKTVPIEETVGAMADLVQAGKVRYLGLSEVSADTLKRAHAVHPITALQSEYSLWTREVEREIIPLCQKLNISFIAYSPLGRGFLTNTLSSPTHLGEEDIRKTHPRFANENFVKNQMLIQQLTELATQKNCTPAQLSLAWMLNKWPQIVPIPGTKRQHYLAENIAATEIMLNAAEIADLDQLFQTSLIAGPRYTDELLRMLDQ